MRPMEPEERPVNHMAPSGPAVIPVTWAFRKLTVPVVGSS